MAQAQRLWGLGWAGFIGSGRRSPFGNTKFHRPEYGPDIATNIAEENDNFTLDYGEKVSQHYVIIS